jgi:FtsZ-binding cell division protein ZapB
LDQEIRDLEAIHQLVQRKKAKMLRLADLQKKIDEATEEMGHLTQDDQDRRPQHRELRQDNSYNDDEWYDDFHHDYFAFDDASPLAAEFAGYPMAPIIQATLAPYAPVCFSFLQLLATKSCCGLPNASAFQPTSIKFV